MANRAGAVFNDVRFVQRVTGMARLAFPVDRLKGDAVMEPVA